METADVGSILAGSALNVADNQRAQKIGHEPPAQTCAICSRKTWSTAPPFRILSLPSIAAAQSSAADMPPPRQCPQRRTSRKLSCRHERDQRSSWPYKKSCPPRDKCMAHGRSPTDGWEHPKNAADKGHEGTRRVASYFGHTSGDDGRMTSTRIGRR